MTYIVNDSCIRCKHMDCVEVCPVDCFYEGENMLVINPIECTEMRAEDVPEDADEWHGVEGKMQYFSEEPGRGD